MSKTALPEMPRYSQDFAIPVADPNNVGYALYIRYYSLWNSDGSREPENKASWPELVLTDSTGESTTPRPIRVSCNDKLKDFSEYTAVVVYSLYPKLDTAQTLNISGFFEQAGYISLALYCLENGGQTEQHYRGDELTVVDGGLNPFVKGNPSVFSYERPAPTPIPTPPHIEGDPISSILLKNNAIDLDNAKIKREKLKNTPRDMEQLSFYRATHESYENGEYGFQESLASDGCSADYLAAFDVLSSEKQYFTLKIKMPTTFIHNDTPDTIYAGYQVQELTIDTYANGLGNRTRYGVNSRQLNDFKDSDGYAYLFLAPEDFVTQLAIEQGLNYPDTRIPPVYTWNGKTGYVLDRGNMVIRHRGSDPAWEGYVGNSTCYLTDAEMQPIQPADLGEYYPELTGVDSLPGLGGAK